MKTKKIICDVLIVGAGISGVAAAISASRQQTKTILIEKNNFPGGIAITAKHHFICGLPPKTRGVARKIILSLRKLKPQNKFIRLGRMSVFSFRNRNLASILRNLMRREKNLKVFYNTKIVGLKKQDGQINSVKVYSRRGIYEIKPKAIIDASGEGIVIKLSKARYQLSPVKSRQMAGFAFEVKGVPDHAGLLAWKIPYYLYRGVKQGRLPWYFRFASFSKGEIKDSGVIRLNLPASNAHRTNKLTRKNASLAYGYLRKILPEFQHSSITQVSSSVSEREGVRLYGEHILTKEEIFTAKKFPQAIARGYWPIEFWHPQKGQQIKYLKPGKFYEIPLGCLKSKNITNLFATGKCISATAQALASTRVMGTCIYLGEAAGKAARNYARTIS